MNTAAQILVGVALVFTVAAAMGKIPLWPAVLILVILETLRVWP